MYGTYGELEGHEGTSAVRYLYNGRDGVQTDSTGLYYMRARYYNPEIKRFINQDVLLGGIEDSTSLNRYSYVNGNPVNYIDPFGLESQGANAFAVAKEIASFVPVLGNVISAYDAIQAFNNGDIKSGIINLAYVVPGLGNVAKVGKLGKHAVAISKKPIALDLQFFALKGTNEKGKVTSRAGWRKSTVKDAWDRATDGQTGGKMCPTCGKEVKVKPFTGEKRDWDIDHVPAWTNREFPEGVTRKSVIDNYQKGTRLECPSCNRSGGNRRD